VLDPSTVDEKGYKYSSSKEWQKIWEEELSNSQLTHYASGLEWIPTNNEKGGFTIPVSKLKTKKLKAAEGFAELIAAYMTGKHDARDPKAKDFDTVNFPKAMKFLKDNKIIKE
jgi:hypothetical protein